MRVHLKVLTINHTRLTGLDEDGEGTVEVEPGTSVAQLAEALQIDDPDPFVVLVNDHPLSGTTRETTRLNDGDTMIVFPPIKGG